MSNLASKVLSNTNFWRVLLWADGIGYNVEFRLSINIWVCWLVQKNYLAILMGPTF